ALRPASAGAWPDDAAAPAGRGDQPAHASAALHRPGSLRNRSVRYGDAAAFRQALEQRLRTRAGGDGARLARDRKRVAFDRLLARLVEVAPERWLLKGGFALDLRLSNRARTTRDVDIDWQAAEDELFDALIDAAALDTDDFFAFEVVRTATPPERLGGSY